jgi:hypothetical protein
LKLPPLCNLDLHSSGMLRSVDWWLVANVSWRRISPIFKGQVDGTDTFPRNICNKLPTYAA